MALLDAARGVGDAADYLDRNIVPLSFFGRRGVGQQDVIPIFAREEATLGAAGPTPPLAVPPPIRRERR